MHVKPNPLSILVLGAGAWGSALANVIARGGHHVVLWTRQQATADAINQTHVHPDFPGIRFSDTLKSSTNIDTKRCDLIVVAIPTQGVRSVLERLETDSVPVLLAAKGIEISTGLFPYQIGNNLMKGPMAVLSGPNFAHEVLEGLPAATTIASPPSLWPLFQKIFTDPTFRVYHSTDLLGVSLGGAIKNVIAIACGIVQGLELGQNAQAALITRALHEIKRLGKALGVDAQTLDGLSGMGDLMLTCFGDLSRNLKFGEILVRHNMEKALASHKTVEGVYTAKMIRQIENTFALDLPICRGVYDVLYDNQKPQDVLARLLSRPLKEEES